MQEIKNKNVKSGLKIAGIALLGAFGVFMSRWHGGGFIKNSPKILKAFLWSLPFAAGSGLSWLHSGFSWWSAACAAAVLIIAMVTKNTGHGGGMDLAHNDKQPGNGREPEKLEYLILWLNGRMPPYWYDFLLLTIIGLASTLAPAVALGVINPWAALPTLLGGAGKAVGYAIGWLVYPVNVKGDGNFDQPTEIGEALAGLFAYVGFGIGLIIAF